MKEYTVISYPCSGSHWLVKFITSYPDDYGLPAHDVTLAPVGKSLVLWDISRPHPDFPNVAFTHDILSIGSEYRAKWNEIKHLWDPEQYSETPLILLMRDPRDVMVSLYYQRTHRQPWQSTFKAIEYDSSIKKDINEFVYNDVHGIKKLVACMNLWIDIPFRISYEDMHKDIRGEMRRLLRYMEIEPVNEKNFEKAIRESSFGAMRLAEEKSTKDYPAGTEESHKIRKGKIGSYKTELSQDTIRFIDEYIKNNLNQTYKRYWG